MALLPLIAALLASASAQEPVQEIVPIAPPPSMDVAPTVAEPTRIALTPLVDGILEADEWDPLTTGTDGSASFMNWEPDAIHLAARVAVGRDAVFSLDTGSDGWLVGNQNVEVRIGLRDAKAVLLVRQLNASTVTGPQWQELPTSGDLTLVAGQESGGFVVYEATVRRYGDALGDLQEGQKIGVRFDALSPEDLRAPFLPRTTTPVTFALTRSAGLPEGATFGLRSAARSVVPGERTQLDLSFEKLTNPAPTRISILTLGGGKGISARVDSPFPLPDSKGRAEVSYPTQISPDARVGWAVVSGTLTGADGVPSIVQASYRISEAVDIELVQRKIPTSPRDLSIRSAYYVRSNSNGPVRGVVKVTTLAPLRILNEPSRKFAILTRRGRSRLSFDLYVPPNTNGVFPLTFTTTVGDKTFTRVQYMRIGG